MTETIHLWDGVAPGSEHATHTEAAFRDEPADDLRIRNVVQPTLTPCLPDPSLANGTAVIIAPGGGFRMLSWESEGTEVATYLTQRGVAAFVLKYRLVDTGETDEDFHRSTAEFIAELRSGGSFRQILDPVEIAPGVVPLAIEDGKQAVRTVRSRAPEWGIRPDAVGFVGFSAGGFVATAVALSEDLTARPDFVAPIYGAGATSPVDGDAPPFFSAVAADDELCLDGCVSTFGRWRAAGRPAELHVYGEGGHGFGARKRGLPIDSWLDRLGDWMQAAGYLP